MQVKDGRLPSPGQRSQLLEPALTPGSPYTLPGLQVQFFTLRNKGQEGGLFIATRQWRNKYGVY